MQGIIRFRRKAILRYLDRRTPVDFAQGSVILTTMECTKRPKHFEKNVLKVFFMVGCLHKDKLEHHSYKN